jgi:hypothetical protein
LAKVKSLIGEEALYQRALFWSQVCPGGGGGWSVER